MRTKIILMLICFILIIPGISPVNSAKKQKAGIYGLNSVKKVIFIDPSSMPEDILEKNDFQSIKYSLSIAGIKFSEIDEKEINSEDLPQYDIIVCPYAAASRLDNAGIRKIKEAVSAGSGLIIDCKSGLSDELGIKIKNEQINVSGVSCLLFPGIPLYWQPHALLSPVARPFIKNQNIICVDESTKEPVVVSGFYGKGKLLFFCAYFDPVSNLGYSRFPFLIEMMEKVFDYKLLAERKTAAMYYDPGNRNFMDAGKLVKLWKDRGIHSIYAGSWYFFDDYTYDYGKLIQACHENGIPVYCWLELPMVNLKFWNRFPQWREKTAAGQDAHVDWRYLMNLADPQCRAEVFSQIGELLDKYDWDGVNIAELYFESTQGPARPEHLTPMNDNVRNEFKTANGFDPVEIFNSSSPHYWKTNTVDWLKFSGYRKELCNRLKVSCLDFLDGIRRKKKDFEIVITAIDASNIPQLEENISEDTDYLLALRDKYGITLQAEDEWMCWTGKPERYMDIGAYYRKYIRKSSLLEIDFNVVYSHLKGEGGLPSEKPTGEEVRQVTYYIDRYRARPVFYSEDGIYAHDFKNINTVLARDTIISEKGLKWEINARDMVTVHTGSRKYGCLLDNAAWHAGHGGSIIIPPGKHLLELVRKKINPGKAYFSLSYISGQMSEAHFYDKSMDFKYNEDNTSCYAVVSRKPGKVYVDHNEVEAVVYESDGGFSIKLPAGSHKVEITAAGK